VFNPRLIIRSPSNSRGSIAPLPQTFKQLEQIAAELAEVELQSSKLSLFVDDGLITQETFRLVRDNDTVDVRITPIKPSNGAVGESSTTANDNAAPASRKRPRDDTIEKRNSQSPNITNGNDSQSKSSATTFESQPESRQSLANSQPQSMSDVAISPPRSGPTRPSASPPSPAPSAANSTTVKNESLPSESRPFVARPSNGQREEIVIDEDEDLAEEKSSQSNNRKSSDENLNSDSNGSSSSSTPTTSASTEYLCATPGCGKLAAFGPCPACLEYKTPEKFRYFCDNDCVQKNWIQHSNLFHIKR